MYTTERFAPELHRFPAESEMQVTARRRILVVEDHALARLSLVDLCTSACRDVEVLEAGSLAAALALHEKHRDSVELVVLDLILPDSKGFAALLTLKRRCPRSRIVALSGVMDDAVAQEARRLGADQFLHKGGDPKALAAALADLMLPLPGSYGRAPRAASRRSLSSTPSTLSPREIEILDLVLQGKTNEEIVAETRLRLGTVKNYISGLFVVFGVASRCRLATLFA